MKSERYLLAGLSLLALAWVVRMIAGVLQLSRLQEVPAAAAVLELAAFLGAAGLPLLGVWLGEPRARRVAWIVWLPCVAYVGFTATRLATHDLAAGLLRLLLWGAIAALFTRLVGKAGSPEASAPPPSTTAR